MVKFQACILCLKMAIDINFYELLVVGDSNLLIHQVQGECVVNNPKITPYIQYIQKLSKRFCKIEFSQNLKEEKELGYAHSTIGSLIKHPDIDCIDPLDIEIKKFSVHVHMLKQKWMVFHGILISRSIWKSGLIMRMWHLTRRNLYFVLLSISF